MAKCERFTTADKTYSKEKRWQLDHTDRQSQRQTMRDRMEWHQSATLRVAHRHPQQQQQRQRKKRVTRHINDNKYQRPENESRNLLTKENKWHEKKQYQKRWLRHICPANGCTFFFSLSHSHSHLPIKS